MPKIRGAFLAEMSEALKIQVVYAPWAMAGGPDAESPKEEASTASTCTFVDQSSPVFLFKEAGIEV